jgi:hypothetical protein
LLHLLDDGDLPGLLHLLDDGDMPGLLPLHLRDGEPPGLLHLLDDGDLPGLLPGLLLLDCDRLSGLPHLPREDTGPTAASAAHTSYYRSAASDFGTCVRGGWGARKVKFENWLGRNSI